MNAQSFYRIGIDIGGTNTDAVLVDNSDKIIASTKVPTTPDIHSGFKEAIKTVIETAQIAPRNIKAVLMGTTHATNAILQGRDLYRVGVLRLSGHHPHLFPVGYGWPKLLVDNILAGCETINGGFECDGRVITTLDTPEIHNALEKLAYQGAESIAIVGTFSPIDPTQEIEAAEIAKDLFGAHFPLSLSHELGAIGFIERENTAILNGALKNVMSKGFKELYAVLDALSLKCPLTITQNNGSLISLQRAINYPILTISAGPTNSFIGAMRLSGADDAIVVDIGGTSTDIGYVQNGFPRRSLNATSIGGIQLNFPMPDVISLALGGGSLVCPLSGKIGPQSVGKDILSKAQAFGGNSLTLFDTALAAGDFSCANIHQLPTISKEFACDVLSTACKQIQDSVALMSGGQKNLPILMVGGGSELLSPDLLGQYYQLPQHFSVANAYGAALAEVTGVANKVISLNNRETALESLKTQAYEAAAKEGALQDTIRIVDIQITPYHYVPNHMARVSIVTAGRKQW